MVTEKNKGFTLMEVLVVTAIMGILAAVVLTSLNNSRESAYVATAQTQLNNIHIAMEIMFYDTGIYPHKKSKYCPPYDDINNEVSLASSTSGMVDTDGTYPNWKGPYIPEAIDPWGTPYYFDEDYQCKASSTGCGGVTDFGTDSSVLVSCGPNRAVANGSCAYDDDNVVYVFCKK